MGFCLLLSAFCCSTLAQTTAFTYQGRLDDGANPAAGIYDLRFTIYDAELAGSPQGGAITNLATPISNGLFTVMLDFGNQFPGAERWLEIGVRTNGGGAFATLSPRQGLTATPYAVRAASATTVPDGTITSTMLADGSVTAEKVAAGAVSQLGSPDGSLLDAVQVHTNGLVGIGTTNPAAGLHIVGGGSVLTPNVLFSAQDDVGVYTRLNGAYSVAVSGNLLAVAAHADSGVTILNISNASAPVLHSQIFDGFAFWTNLAGAGGVALAGNLLAIAAPADNAVTLVGVGAPGVLTKWAELRDGLGGFDFLASPVAVGFSGNLLAIAAQNDHAVTLVDVSNPGSPVLRASLVDGVAGFNHLATPVEVAFSGNLLAIAAASDQAVTLVDVSNPALPAFRAVLRNGMAGFDRLSNPRSLAFSGNLLAIASFGDAAVTLVDVSNPASPVLRAVLQDGVGEFQSLDGACSVAFAGNLLAVAASSDNAITLADISNPANPVLRGVFRQRSVELDPLHNSPQDLVFAGSLLAAVSQVSDSLMLIEPLPTPLSLLAEGWVGIGTALPRANLHVTGNMVVEEADLIELRANRVALGLGTVANGNNTTVMGSGTKASGGGATAMGSNTSASGDVSTAMGYQSSASGDFSTAMGSSHASGELSTAMGTSFAQGFAATAMGDNSTASGTGATAMGRTTFAQGFAATAMGELSEATNPYTLAAGRRAKASHTGSFVWTDSQNADFASTANDQFNIRAKGGVRLSEDTPFISFGSDLRRQMLHLLSTNYGIGVQVSTLYQRSNSRFSWFQGGTHSDTQNDPGGGTVLMTLNSGGLTVNGAFVSASDRNVKEDFQPVNPTDVLDKVLALPLQEWTYKSDDERSRHLGPMAQDFRAAFGLGADDKYIATVDADGVALAAIQGLNQKLERENAALKARLEKLEQIISQQPNHHAP